MTARRILAATTFAATLASAAHAQNLETIAASRQYRGERALDVQVRFGVGDFVLHRDQGSALYRASVVYDRRFEPILDYSRNGNKLELGIDTRGNGGLRNLRDIKGQKIEVFISPAVPMNFDFEFGAGKADLDLGGLALQRAEIKTGASETAVVFSRPTVRPCERFKVEVGAAELRLEGLGNSNCANIQVEGAAGSLLMDFTGEWQHQGQTEASIRFGLGGLTLRFPSDLGVSIRVQRFLASFDGSGFRREGNRYISRNYETARSKLDLDLQAAVGDIVVEWVQGR